MQPLDLGGFFVIFVTRAKKCGDFIDLSRKMWYHIVIDIYDNFFELSCAAVTRERGDIL